MKISLLVLGLASMVSLSKSAYTKLFWSEEFNDNTLNTSEWDYKTGYLRLNNELQSYTDRNSYMKDGFLNIVAKNEAADGARYTSTRLMSKTSFKYGRIEARIKVPKGNGMWPAFWLLPIDSPYGRWPDGGEIDILETSDNMDFIDATIHFGSNGKHDMANERTRQFGDLSNDFHIYAVEWEEKQIRWYVDDVLYSTKNSDRWWSNFGGTAPFDGNFHIILNLAVGGNYPNYAVDDSVFPHTMQVDYVRVYKDENSNEGPQFEGPQFSPEILPEPVVFVPEPEVFVPEKSENSPKAQVCHKNACPTNDINDCRLNDKGLIFCVNCPASAKNMLRCGGTDPHVASVQIPALTVKPQVCSKTSCPSGKLADCKLNDKGRIYCSNCPAYAKNLSRCGGTEDPDNKCENNGGCLNNSKCSVNSENKIYCRGCPKGFYGDRCEKKRSLRGAN